MLRLTNRAWLHAALVVCLAVASSVASAAKSEQKLETATFAGGCFWCVESDFDHVPGVVETISGYTGGTTANPTYKDVTYGKSGHYEAVKITFDANVISYRAMVDIFWRSVDPTDAGGQFCDRGESYRTAVFAHSEAQSQAARASKVAAAAALGNTIVTPIINASPFYIAEDEHQNYYDENPLRYRYYRSGCGRDNRLKFLWGAEALKGIHKN